MDLLRTTGIVLRTSPVMETSLIVIWLTRDFGKLRTLAKGGRRRKSPFRGALEPFSVDELLYLRSRRSDLHLLHECSLIEQFRNLRAEYAKITTAVYFCELADLATQPEHAEPDLFTLLHDALRALNDIPWQPLHPHQFEVHLLAALGLDAARLQVRLAPDVLKLIQRLRELAPDQLGRLRISPSQAVRLRDFLGRQITAQFGHLPRSRRFVATLAE